MSYNYEFLKNNCADFKVLSTEEVLKISTQRLLTIYKKVRRIILSDFEDFDFLDDMEREVKINTEKYKEAIKKELNSREHIKKKTRNTNNPKRNKILLKRVIKNHKLYEMSKSEIKDFIDKYHYKRWLYNNNTTIHGFGLNEIFKLSQEIKHSRKVK